MPVSPGVAFARMTVCTAIEFQNVMAFCAATAVPKSAMSAESIMTRRARVLIEISVFPRGWRQQGYRVSRGEPTALAHEPIRLGSSIDPERLGGDEFPPRAR